MDSPSTSSPGSSSLQSKKPPLPTESVAIPVPAPSNPSTKSLSSAPTTTNSTTTSTTTSNPPVQAPVSGSTSASTSTDTQQVDEARNALEASLLNIGTSLDGTLKTQAQTLHNNAASLRSQQTELERNTAGLRKETEKLRRTVEEGQRRVKELGNVQNWAEVIERDFLVLQETLRLVGEGERREREEGWVTDGDGDEDGVSESDGSWSGSQSRSGSLSGDEADAGTKGKMKAEGVLGNRVVDKEGDTDMLGESGTRSKDDERADTGIEPTPLSTHPMKPAGDIIVPLD